MQMFELIKRISIREKIEDSVHREELMLLKIARKYNVTLKEVKKSEAASNDQLDQRQTDQRRLRALQKKNRRLQQIYAKSRELEHLQAEYENIIRQQEIELMRKCIKKECSNVFLNTRALSEAATGMSIRQSQWLPFSFPIDSLNMSEVPLKFWSHTQSHSNDEQWDKLIVGSISLN